MPQSGLLWTWTDQPSITGAQRSSTPVHPQGRRVHAHSGQVEHRNRDHGSDHPWNRRLQKMKQVAGGNPHGERAQDAGKPIAEIGKFTHEYSLTSATEIAWRDRRMSLIGRHR
jgi:hypothetical protein